MIPWAAGFVVVAAVVGPLVVVAAQSVAVVGPFVVAADQFVAEFVDLAVVDSFVVVVVVVVVGPSAAVVAGVAS